MWGGGEKGGWDSGMHEKEGGGTEEGEMRNREWEEGREMRQTVIDRQLRVTLHHTDVTNTEAGTICSISPAPWQ